MIACVKERRNEKKVDFNTLHDQELLEVLHEQYVFLRLWFSVLFQGKTQYKPSSPRRWTSPFCLRYLDDSILVRQQGIYEIPRRHPRLFQAVFPWWVFLGTEHGFRRRGHLYRHKRNIVRQVRCKADDSCMEKRSTVFQIDNFVQF